MRPTEFPCIVYHQLDRNYPPLALATAREFDRLTLKDVFGTTPMQALPPAVAPVVETPMDMVPGLLLQIAELEAQVENLLRELEIAKGPRRPGRRPKEAQS